MHEDVTDSSAIDALSKLFAIMQEDYETFGRDWSRPGLHAVWVHRFGNWRMSVRSRAIRLPLSATYKLLFTLTRNLYGIEVPYNARLGRRVVFEHQHGIVIHGSAEIGDDTIIRQGVTIGIRRMDRLDEAPRIGRGVNIGAGAKLLGGISIGDDAAIGANSVVLQDVPAGCLAVGIPALVQRRKPREVRRDAA